MCGKFNYPYGVAGNVYVADTANDRIEILAPIPFEFSSAIGIFSYAGMLGLLYLRKKP